MQTLTGLIVKYENFNEILGNCKNNYKDDENSSFTKKNMILVSNNL